MLNPQAKAAYRVRLAELEANVEEAKAFNDPERAASAQAQIDFLAQELARGVGLGGRDRKAASSAERAPGNVTRTIKDAVEKITDHAPSLGRHLSATIKTGIFCAYIPDPHTPVAWQF